MLPNRGLFYIVVPETVPRPRGEAAPVQSRAGQAMLGLEVPRTLLAQIQQAMEQDPQLPLPGAALQPLTPQAIQGCPSQVQNPTLSLVKVHTVGDCPSLIC